MTCSRSRSKDTSCLAIGWPGSAVKAFERGSHKGQAGLFASTGHPGKQSISSMPLASRENFLPETQVDQGARCPYMASGVSQGLKRLCGTLSGC